jgi:WXXGXW repeat (2 copies)
MGHPLSASAALSYVWVPGYWTVPPAGHVRVPGHRETRPDGSAWVDGRWQRTLTPRALARPGRPG